MLHYLAFPPADLFPLVFLVPVPLTYFALRYPTKKGVLGWSLLWGVAYSLAAFSWIRYPTVGGWLGVGLIMSVYYPLYALGLRACFGAGARPSAWRLALAVAVLWVGVEDLRGYLYTGMPWFLLGQAWIRAPIVVQSADLVGSAGASFLTAAAAGWLTCVGLEFRGGGGRLRRVGLATAAGIALLWGLNLAYGARCLSRSWGEPGPRLLLVQANVAQSLKESGEDPDQIYNRQMRLSRDAPEVVDLIVWAETMYPFPVGMFPEYRVWLEESATDLGRPLLAGAVRYDELDGGSEVRVFNSAFLVEPTQGVVEVYDKRHLVPVSEYVPFRGTFPILNDVIVGLSDLQNPPDLSEGDRDVLFQLGGRRFYVVICFESVFSAPVRRAMGEGADFVVNLSNDGWFGDSAELEQILDITCFRAIENRVGVARCTNTGISAFIDPDGRRRVLRDDAGRVKDIPGTLGGVVRCATGRTWFQRGGFFFEHMCLLLSVLLPGLGLRRRRISDKIPREGQEGSCMDR